MEFHQMRYFLALSSTLNFTRAAEMCNVSQPALTRAIKNLEHELGGELLRREGRLTHLTELGRRVTPMLRDSYQKALSAKALARSCSDGEEAMLRLAISGTVGLDQLADRFLDLFSAFDQLPLKIERGSNEQVFERLKSGEVELGFADSEVNFWDRFESWTVEREEFALGMNRSHRLASHDSVHLHDLCNDAIICLPHCGLARELIELLPGHDPERHRVLEVATLGDIHTLLKLNVGIALLPVAAELPDYIVRKPISGMVLEHVIKLWAVAGRPRSRAAEHLVRQVQRNHALSTLSSASQGTAEPHVAMS